MQHRNYKCLPWDIFGGVSESECFLFQTKYCSLQWESKTWIFNEVVFQVADIFSRKQTPSEEICLMRSLIFFFFFSHSMQYAAGKKRFLPSSRSFPEQIKMQSWNAVLNSSIVLVNPKVAALQLCSPSMHHRACDLSKSNFLTVGLGRLSFVSLADELMPSPSNYQVVLRYVMKV